MCSPTRDGATHGARVVEHGAVETDRHQSNTRYGRGLLRTRQTDRPARPRLSQLSGRTRAGTWAGQRESFASRRYEHCRGTARTGLVRPGAPGRRAASRTLGMGNRWSTARYGGRVRPRTRKPAWTRRPRSSQRCRRGAGRPTAMSRWLSGAAAAPRRVWRPGSAARATSSRMSIASSTRTVRSAQRGLLPAMDFLPTPVRSRICCRGRAYA